MGKTSLSALSPTFQSKAFGNLLTDLYNMYEYFNDIIFKKSQKTEVFFKVFSILKTVFQASKGTTQFHTFYMEEVDRGLGGYKWKERRNKMEGK